MTMASKNLEKQLRERGYHIYRCCEYDTDAEQLVKELRADGYFARVLEYATDVPGFHDFTVWAKRK